MVGSVKKISVVILLLNFLLTSFSWKITGNSYRAVFVCVFFFVVVCLLSNESGDNFFKKKQP